jgi:hypothetical protein
MSQVPIEAAATAASANPIATGREDRADEHQGRRAQGGHDAASRDRRDGRDRAGERGRVAFVALGRRMGELASGAIGSAPRRFARLRVRWRLGAHGGAIVPAMGRTVDSGA